MGTYGSPSLEDQKIVLKKCAHCGEEIWQSLDICPRCGKNPDKRKKGIFRHPLFWIFIICILALFIWTGIEIILSDGAPEVTKLPETNSSGLNSFGNVIVTNKPTNAPKLTKIPKATNTPKPINTPKPTIPKKDDIKNKKTTASYTDLCRYAEKNTGEYVVIDIDVLQKITDDGVIAYRSKDIDSNEWVVIDDRADNSVRILEDDVIIAYGVYVGLIEMTRSLTNTTVELPCVRMYYADIYGVDDVTDSTEAVPTGASIPRVTGTATATPRPTAKPTEAPTSTPTNAPKPTATNTPTPTPDDGDTISQRNALKQAKSYLNFTSHSYNGLIELLEYEGYSKSDATFAADNCGANWYEQAAYKAKDYLDFIPYSRSGLIELLEYEGFTGDEAVYGVDNCKADWFEQAVNKANEYLRFSSFSRSGLIEQLKYEGFTNDEATYGVDSCNIDWFEQAVNKANEYLDLMPFSRDGLIQLLEFEGFTDEQAVHAVDQVGL